MPADRTTLSETLVTEREVWQDGPPHGLFKELRGKCPVHWTSRITEYPEEAGYWSVTRADDVHEVSHDFQTYSSELGGVTELRRWQLREFGEELLKAVRGTAPQDGG